MPPSLQAPCFNNFTIRRHNHTSTVPSYGISSRIQPLVSPTCRRQRSNTSRQNASRNDKSQKVPRGPQRVFPNGPTFQISASVPQCCPRSEHLSFGRIRSSGSLLQRNLTILLTSFTTIICASTYGSRENLAACQRKRDRKEGLGGLQSSPLRVNDFIFCIHGLHPDLASQTPVGQMHMGETEFDIPTDWSNHVSCSSFPPPSSIIASTVVNKCTRAKRCELLNSFTGLLSQGKMPAS